jgi:subfamily B ATP-binding cassette protein MsbA
VLIIFLIRVNQAIRSAVKEVRNKQSDLLATLQEGLQSIEVVQAYSREDYEDRQVQEVGKQTVTAWLKTRKLSALLTPVISLVIAVCTGLVLWRGALLILGGTMTAGALTVFLAYLARFFQPVRALSQMSNTLAQVGGVSAGHRGV